MKYLLIIFLALAVLAPSAGFSEKSLKANPEVTRESYGALPLNFEPNQGQTDRSVKFLARGDGYTLFLTNAEAVLAFNPAQRVDGTKAQTSQRGVLRMTLIGAATDSQIEGLAQLPGVSNYFIGKSSQSWQTGIPHYGRVQVSQIYPGVDVVYYGNQGQLEYDFLLAPGADPNSIQLAFEGADQMKLNASGDLLLNFAGSSLRLLEPVAYQEVDNVRKAVESRYVLTTDGHVALQLGSYDRSLPLVIDPVLAYSSYLGGSAGDYGNGIAVDGSGNAYVVGQAGSTDFPTTAGSFQPAISGDLGYTDAFVTKISSVGNAVVYSTYLGGSGPDVALGVAVDANGSAYVIGEESSSNFPVTAGAFQTQQMGWDAFVVKLNPTGSGLAYASHFGSAGDDHGLAIALDSSGNAYTTGWTTPPLDRSFPIVNAFQPNYGGGNNDAFVTKLNASGSALVYSTYLGGGTVLNATDDWGQGIAVDSAGSAYVVGATYSPDFPFTAGAFNTPKCGLDVFVTKFSPAGSSLVYSARIGGGTRDHGLAIAVDGGGNAYFTGYTESQDSYPVTTGAFQRNGSFDAFVTKLNPQGSGLVYSTYLGGAGDVDRGWGIKVDAAGNAYVVGDTKSSDFPTVNAIQSAYGGGLGDAFVSKLSPTGSSLVYSTFLGGNLTDMGRGIALDSSANAYVTGMTSSFQFPVSNPFQGTNGGGINNHDDAFVAKISDTTATPSADLSLTMTDSPDPAAMGSNVTFTLTVSNAGPVTATAVTLTVRPNSIFRIVSITPTQGTCSAPDGVNMFTCNLASIGAGANARVTFTATMPQATGSLLSDAFVSGHEFDPNNSNNSASQVTTVTTNTTSTPTSTPGSKNTPTPTFTSTPTSTPITTATFTPTPTASSAPVLASLTLNPTSVTGGSSSQGTVTLSAAAPSGGAVVLLSSSNTNAATVPQSVTVPAGTTSIPFTVSTRSVSSSTPVTISASYAGVTRSAVLTVTATDTVTITRAEYIVSKSRLRIDATSTNTAATLSAYVTSTSQSIGTLVNNGNGRYSLQVSWPSNPQNITIRSSAGGSATMAVTPR
jgi:uncharacterized repeat protein (TIGR01451 family)